MSILVELREEAYVTDAFSNFAAGDGFTLGNGRAMAWMAQLAYESDLDKIDRRLQAWGLQRLARLDAPFSSTLPLKSTHGIVAAGRGATIVAFAGTDPLVITNWITDLNARLSPQGVHSGFEQAVEAAWPQVAAALRQRPTAGAALYITGHSLGGALAVVAAERAARDLGLRAHAVYTFGQPRSGGEDFAAAYAGAGLADVTYRLVHGHDIVPTLPPPQLQFRHVGRMLKCAHGARFTADLPFAPASANGPPFVDTVVAGLKQRLFHYLTRSFLPSRRGGLIGLGVKYLTPAIGDHVPERYWAAFEPE